MGVWGLYQHGGNGQWHKHIHIHSVLVISHEYSSLYSKESPMGDSLL